MRRGRQTNKQNLFISLIKTGFFCFFAFLIYLSFLPVIQSAPGINEVINFQGKIVNKDGTNIIDGSYAFIFRLYNASSGGILLWEETWDGGTSLVSVRDGIFQVELGTYENFSSLNFNSDNLFLSIEFNHDGEMDPRIHFTSVPYAHNAKKVSGLNVANTTGSLNILDGKTISFGDDFTTQGAFGLTLTTTDITNATFPDGAITVTDTTTSQTLTNKTLTTGSTWKGNLVTTNYGGTGINSYNAGDLLFYSSGTAFSTLGIGPINSVLISDGAMPSWGQIGSSFIVPDSLDFTEFKDLLTLDSDLAIDSSLNNYSINFLNNLFYLDSLDNRVGLGGIPLSDKFSLWQTIATTSENAFKINYTQIMDVTSISGSALEINVVSSGDATDNINAINIRDLINTGSLETALIFGSGWDREVVFKDLTPSFEFLNNAEFSFTDGVNNLMQMKDLSTNFGASFNAGAFIDRNSTLQEEFNKIRTTRTNDTNGTNGAGMGDGGGFGVYEGKAIGCNFSTPQDEINGILRVQALSGGSGCLLTLDEATSDPRLIFNIANLPVLLMKVKPSLVSGTNNIFVGLGDEIDGNLNNPNNFIGFTNNGGAEWVGMVSSGGAQNKVTCSGQTVSVSSFALLMVEVIAGNDIRFFVDNDVSNGVNFVQCGTSLTSNIPTSNLAPQAQYQSKIGGTANDYLDLDFFRAWQDDAKESAMEKKLAIDLKEIQEKLSYDSNITELFPSDDLEMEGSFLVSVQGNEKDFKVKKAIHGDSLVGISVKNQGLEINNGTFEGIRVATHGRAFLKTSLENGEIKSGDWLTASSTPGVAMKAKLSGMVIGQALTEFSSQQSDEVKEILVLINPSFINQNSNVQSDKEEEKTEKEIQDITKEMSDEELVLTYFKKLNQEGIVVIDDQIEFTKQLNFNKAVSFKDPVSFNENTIGSVIFKKDQRRLEVKFKEKLTSVPIIQVSISLQEIEDEEQKKEILEAGIMAVVSKENEEGFVVELNKEAPENLKINWSAFLKNGEQN